MPGIDYSLLREQIPMARVLELLEYEPLERRGDQLRGPCPIHESQSAKPRTFSVDLAGNRFRCFKFQAQGNQLDLWAQAKSLDLHTAAKDLCQKAGVEVPWVTRW